MKLQPGQVANFSFGPTPERIILSVRVDRHLDGVAIIVNSGRTTLDRTYGNDNLVGARAYLEHIRDAARAGQAVWLIEAGVSALIDAAQATQAERGMIYGIRANMQQATPQPADVADILDDIPVGGGWNAYRQSCTSKAAVISEPMDRILTTAVDGWIPRSKSATSVQLIALSRRGLVELVHGRRGNQRVILGAQVTGKGAKHADAEMKEKAA